MIRDVKERRSQSEPPKTEDLLPSIWAEYCDRTSLHGFKFLSGRESSKFHSIGWAFVILSSFIAVSILGYVNVDEFVQSSVSFNLESPTTPLTQVYFPSIVICKMNFLRKSFIYSLLEDPALTNVTYEELHQTIADIFIEGTSNQSLDSLTRQQEIVDQVLNTTVYLNLFEEILNDSLVEEASFGNIPIAKWRSLEIADRSPDNLDNLKRSAIVELASQFRDGEMVAWIQFSGFGAYYEPGFGTDIGETCSWLTPYWMEPTTMLDLGSVPSVSNGGNNGFQMLLDAESYDYASSPSGSEGFVIAMLHHLDIPIMKHTGIQIQTGQSVQVAVSPTLIDTTQPCKRRFSPKKRQCYFQDEIDLRHFPHDQGYRYEMSNCLFEATLQKIEETCGCTPVKYIDVVEGFEACEGAEKECMNNLINFMGQERWIEDGDEIKECLAACQDQKHTFLVTGSVFPSSESFHLSDDYCKVFNKVRHSCSMDRRITLDQWNPAFCPTLDRTLAYTCQEIQDDLANITRKELRKLRQHIVAYANKNMAKVNVYVRDSYVKKYLTEEKITEISFVGNIGGLLGLFTGFSFISVAEILYYLCCGKGRRRPWAGLQPPNACMFMTTKQKTISPMYPVPSQTKW
ncbi:hypothetical protein TCAL_07005 [Tigriopus californicus]|uniref:Pickpocket protein 28 n=1 Tax=Tigriopus californicus TaxID=6832 RepID=A0A553PDQ1_TIGCA|nr:uncharacterized protein LOC131876827 isoform X1 [Tigriopus californicus]TRY75809.1 hypothetical protein TCAL_07005 [Tigriopus californicus]